LTEGLVKEGHDVTLFATGDSVTSAKLMSVYPRSLYTDGVSWSNAYWPSINISKAIEYSRKIKADIIHSHSQYYGYVFSPLSPIPMLHTHHGTLKSQSIGKEKQATLDYFKKANYISISRSQREPMPYLNWVGNVYNGIDVDSFYFNARKGQYLLWMGRFTPKKGSKEAIIIANKTKRKLILAGKIEKNNRNDYNFYKKEIKPLIDNKNICYVGEVSQGKKVQLYKNALCLLNTIKWDEPFGLIPMEANACGTPVISFAEGALNETIKNGHNGFLIKPNNLNGMIKSLKDIDKIDRLTCRKWVEDKFSVSRMVTDYIKVYQKFVKK